MSTLRRSPTGCFIRLLLLVLLLFGSTTAKAADTEKTTTTEEAKDTKETKDTERLRPTEGWLIDGIFAIGTGLQGGDPGAGGVAWTRARTRVLSGIDLRNDESHSNGLGFYGFAEIEQRTSFGGEVRFQHWWTPTIAFYGGFLGVVFPETMVGMGVGARLGFPIGKKATLFLEPGFAAFPIGSDLPGNGVLLWGTLSGGIGVAL